MHRGLKRNFQVMNGAEWLELLCRHIPDRSKHLVHLGSAIESDVTYLQPPIVAAIGQVRKFGTEVALP